MRKENWVLIISFTALIISVIAICISSLRSQPIEVEWANLLVGVLSVLVTTLIGWNIYTLVDIANTRKKIDEISKGTSSYIEKYMTISEGANWMIYHYLLLGNDPLGIQYRFIYHGVSALYHASKVDDIQTCNIIVKGLLECIKDPHKIILKKEEKKDILRIVASIKGVDRVSGFLELLNRLALIQVE